MVTIPLVCLFGLKFSIFHRQTGAVDKHGISYPKIFHLESQLYIIAFIDKREKGDQALANNQKQPLSFPLFSRTHTTTHFIILISSCNSNSNLPLLQQHYSLYSLVVFHVCSSFVHICASWTAWAWLASQLFILFRKGGKNIEAGYCQKSSTICKILVYLDLFELGWVLITVYPYG